MTASILIATFGDRAYWDRLADQAVASAEVQTVPVEIIRHHIDDPDQRACGRARNEAAKRATGDRLLNLDADDLLAPDFMEHMLAHLEGDVVVPSIQNQRPNGTWTEPGVLQPCRMLDGAWPVIGSLIRTEDFWRIGGFRDLEWGEDSDLWLRAELAGLTFSRCRAAVYRIGYREGSRKSHKTRDAIWQKLRMEAVERMKAR